MHPVQNSHAAAVWTMLIAPVSDNDRRALSSTNKPSNSSLSSSFPCRPSRHWGPNMLEKASQSPKSARRAPSSTFGDIFLGRTTRSEIPVLESFIEDEEEAIMRTLSEHPESSPQLETERLNSRVNPSTFSLSSSWPLISVSLSLEVERHVLRSGWLNKQSDHLKSWNRRFFVLIERIHSPTKTRWTSLQYYKSDQCGRIRGDIPIQNASPAETAYQEACDADDFYRHPITTRFVGQEESKRPYCFEVGRGHIHFLCQALDEDDVSAWVYELQAIAQGHPVDSPASIRAFPQPAQVDQTNMEEDRTRDSVWLSESYLGRRMHETSSWRASSSVSSMRLARKQPGRPRMDSTDVATLLSHQSDTPKPHAEIEICFVAELRRLLNDSNSQESTICSNFVKSFSFDASHSIAPFARLRAFHGNITEMILRDHSLRMLELVQDKTPDSDHLFALIRTCTYRHLEQCILLPIRAKLEAYLSHEYHAQDIQLYRKTQWLKGKDQFFFHIPDHHLSPREWHRAAKVLRTITTTFSPTARYQILVKTIQKIKSTYSREHNDVLKYEDLLPIFTFVTVNSGVEYLASIWVLLSELNMCFRSEESDRNIKLLKDALSFIESVQTPPELEDVFKDSVTVTIDGDLSSFLSLEPEPTYRYGVSIASLSAQGLASFGTIIGEGFVLMTLNGQNVLFWSYSDVLNLLTGSTHSHKFSFIASESYSMILQTNKILWNESLLNACKRGDIGCVQMLLANGADVNYAGHDCRRTALHVAVEALKLNVVSYLLQHGALSSKIDDYGRTPLHMVGLSSRSPCDPTWDTQIAIVVRKLLHHGSHHHNVDMFGNTALMLLAANGYLSGIDIFIEARHDVELDARNWTHGMTALMMAAQRGHYQVVQALLDYGAKVDCRTLDGETALHFAASVARRNICELLVEHGAAVNITNKAGISPLMLALCQGNCHKLIRSDSLDLSCRNTATFTQVVAESSSKYGKYRIGSQKYNQADENHSFVSFEAAWDTVRYLLAARSDTSTVCKAFFRPADYAAKFANDSLFKLIQATDDSCEPSKLCNSTSEDETSLDIHQPIEAILLAVVESDRVDWDDVAALLCYWEASRRWDVVIHSLQSILGATSSKKSKRSLRMVLQILHRMVMLLQYNTGKDPGYAKDLHCLISFAYKQAQTQDPQAVFWIKTHSLLPRYQEAYKLGQRQHLQMFYMSHQIYEKIHVFLRRCKFSSANLAFLVDSQVTDLSDDDADDDIDDALIMDPLSNNFGRMSLTPTLRSSTSCENPQSRDASMELDQAIKDRLSMAGVWPHQKREIEDPTCVENHMLPKSVLPSFRKCAFHSRFSFAFQCSNQICLLDLEPMAVAQQLTLLQHYYFTRVRASEITASRRDADQTPGYDRLRKLHYHISMWVVSQILVRDDADQRAQLLEFFGRVANYCLSPLQNFDGFMTIINASNDSSIHRLKKTWDKLPLRSYQLWRTLNQFTQKAARTMIRAMEEASPPCVPYLGTVLQQLIALQECPAYCVLKKSLNINKFRYRNAILQKVIECQNVPFLIPMDAHVLRMLCSPPSFANQEAAFQRSLVVETRAQR
uniref:Rasspecific guanine nucleotidereleasing factor putat n=1 Tax=Albugo laibachii Nc14 TaxID=890382 RepID=F0WV56_9STRA|nr:rasspecific guanine nucleotidereleasing factor putat [Albugo laibachii Nc14]|eukprot:CCA25295.1 rasspecific guanine nucleotidereleasing factor putat [Albugo laibachii Nc14]